MSSAPLPIFLILNENPRVASRQAWSQKKTLDANFTAIWKRELQDSGSLAASRSCYVNSRQ